MFFFFFLSLSVFLEKKKEKKDLTHLWEALEEYLHGQPKNNPLGEKTQQNREANSTAKTEIKKNLFMNCVGLDSIIYIP